MCFLEVVLKYKIITHTCAVNVDDFFFLKNLYKSYEMDFTVFGFIGTGTDPTNHAFKDHSKAFYK